MKARELHSWDASPKEAREIQQMLALTVDSRNQVNGSVSYVAGLDVSPPDEGGLIRGAAVVLSYPDLELVETQIAVQAPRFPYVPGLLSFREAPVLLEALEALAVTPDLIIVDAQGYAHPRRFGLACHIGLLADIPTIGCAKSLLIGTHDELADDRGATADLMHRGELIGLALRTKPRVRPLYVSVGHHINLPTAAHWVLACGAGYRLPQTTRMAHATAGGHPMPQTRRRVAAL